MHRPVKRPRSNARPSAVVEPVSNSPEKCHPFEASRLNWCWWGDVHDTVDLSRDRFLSQ